MAEEAMTVWYQLNGRSLWTPIWPKPMPSRPESYPSTVVTMRRPAKSMSPCVSIPSPMRSAAYLGFRQQRLEEAIRYYEKSMTLMETDLNSGSMLVSCYTAVGNSQAALRVAQITLSRTEKTLAQDPNNGAAMAYGANALAVLGEAERAKDWISRALLIDPDNMNARYNFACVLTTHLKEPDAALELLGSIFETLAIGLLNHAKADPDLDPLRDDPRFKAMVAAAEARLAGASDEGAAPES